MENKLFDFFVFILQDEYAFTSITCFRTFAIPYTGGVFDFAQPVYRRRLYSMSGSCFFTYNLPFGCTKLLFFHM
jgi:hypothetical protein